MHCMLMSAGGFAIYRTESLVYSVLKPAFGDLATRVDRANLADLWFNSEPFRRSGLDEAELRPRILQEPRSAGDFLRLIMDEMIKWQGAVRWADSTPEHGLHIPEIRRQFPGAKFIHMIRDGRDVAASLAKLGFIRPFTRHHDEPWRASAAYWDWIVGRIREYGRAGDGDYLEVRFPDLLGDRPSTTARIGEFIGHDLDLDRIDRVSIGSVGTPNTSFPGEEAANSALNRQSKLDSATRQELTLQLRKRLEQTGYPVDTGAAKPRLSGELDKALYQARFGLRTRLKQFPPLGRRFADVELFRVLFGQEEVDKTLRPARHRQLIRTLVKPELPPDFDSSELMVQNGAGGDGKG